MIIPIYRLKVIETRLKAGERPSPFYHGKTLHHLHERMDKLSSSPSNGKKKSTGSTSTHTFILNKLTIIIGLPQRDERIPRIISILLLNKFPQVPSGLFGVPKRDFGEEMVYNVVMRDIVQEETALPS